MVARMIESCTEMVSGGYDVILASIVSVCECVCTYVKVIERSEGDE